MIGGAQRIALVGKTGVGKTEVAKHLIDTGFAPCKTGAICREISLLLFGNDWKVNTQKITDALIPLQPSIFLRAALRDWDPDVPAVIDALRFQSDLQIARENGFRIIRVIASDGNRAMWLKGRGEVFDFQSDGVHQTEVELDSEEADVTLANDGTLDDLKRQVDEVLASF
jgi:dephospho-CoA kinase